MKGCMEWNPFMLTLTRETNSKSQEVKKKGIINKDTFLVSSDIHTVTNHSCNRLIPPARGYHLPNPPS